MVNKRVRLNKSNLYFSDENEDLKFINTGCELYNCALGGGYVMNRVINIVGDKSSGKTLLAIEACANFHKDYPDGEIHYLECESAFDKPYARKLGMPIEATNFQEDLSTVEELFNYLEDLMVRRGLSPDNDCLVIVDSLDALSDKAEQERKIDDGTYGTKAKMVSTVFRKSNRKWSKSRITLIIISQIRDNIGVMFGKKHKRSGGKALDFYASQVVWLAEIKKLTKTVQKVTRPIGVEIKAKIEKNKVGQPFRECVYPIYFNYGIDDIEAGVNWLKSTGNLNLIGFTEKTIKSELNRITSDPPQEKAFRKKLNNIIKKKWKEIEINFMPNRSKY